MIVEKGVELRPQLRRNQAVGDRAPCGRHLLPLSSLHSHYAKRIVSAPGQWTQAATADVAARGYG